MRSIILSIILLVGACGSSSQFHCADNGQCDLRPGGICSTGLIGGQLCAYPDSNCESGYSYDDRGSFAGVCTIAPEPPDAHVEPPVDATVDGQWPDAEKPAARWMLLTGNCRTDRTDPNNPVAAEQLVLYAPDDAGGYAAVWKSPEKDWTRSVAWADYDGDGDLDFAAGNGLKSTRRLRVYRNDGNNTFSAIWTAPTPAYTYVVQWSDFDGDGKLDMVAAASKTIRFYKSMGGDVFVERDVYSGGLSDVTALDIVDMDKDGDMDVATAAGGAAIVLRNHAGVLNELWRAPSVDTGVSVVAWGDYDKDGFSDLAIDSVNSFAVYHQSPTSFVKAFDGLTDLPASIPVFEPRAIAWVDYDGDLDLDLVIASLVPPVGGGALLPDRPRVFKNTGGTFTLGWEASDPMMAYDLTVADYDNDGDPDIAIAADGPDVVFENMGTGRFVSRWSSATVDNTAAISWAPF